MWDAENTSGKTPLCTTISNSTSVQNGRFRIALAPECRAAVADHPDTWVEVVVAGQSLGVAKVGAVPYAIEADRAQKAAGATGALEAQLGALKAAFLAQVRTSDVTGAANTHLEATAQCNAGELLLSGGCTVPLWSGTHDAREAALQENGPTGSNAWRCVLGASGLGNTASRTLRAHAVCITPPPG